jgi:hypothetical protein
LLEVRKLYDFGRVDASTIVACVKMNQAADFCCLTFGYKDVPYAGMRRALPAPRQALEYQQKPPARRRWTRRVVAGVIGILTLLIVARVGPVAWRQVRMLSLQRKCLTYSAPAGSVIASIPGGTATPLPEWQAMYMLVSGNALQSSGTVFVHELVSTDGDRRLVGVDASWRTVGEHLYVAFTSRVIALGTAFTPPREIVNDWDPTAIADLGNVSPSDQFQVMAGEVDAEDPSHFILKITRGDQTFACDGWLLHNDKVVIQQRLTSPATQPRSIPDFPEALQ